MILLKIKAEYQHYLGHIRHWDGLKVAREDGYLWVNGLSEEQIGTNEVMTIPFASCFVVNDGMLFPIGATLPVAKQPQLLWSPIAQGIPVELPDYNFNYFGIEDQIDMKLEKADATYPEYAIAVSLDVLASFLRTVPAIRLRDLTWCLMGNESALILGLPVPAISGKTFWKHEDTLIPAGFHYQFVVLARQTANKLNPEKDQWIIWTDSNSQSLIPKNHFMPLNRNSFRLSQKYMQL